MKKAIINGGIGSKVICAVTDDATLEAAPIKGTDNGDGTASLLVTSSMGAVTVAHSAITDTATSEEIDCRGYNSLLVHFVSDSAILTWTISVQGAMGSGLTFVPLLDKATGLAASEITTDISGFFVISNIPDYVKIVATEVDDGATVTVTVQPFNG